MSVFFQPNEGELHALREIGWSKWDPIGLVADRKHCDDEYDAYLIAAVRKCKGGSTLQAIQDYFVKTEIEYIGLNRQPDTETRAFATATAIMIFASSI